jgi:flagellar biosynthesis/type III secretory pathway protein FliH
VERSDDLAPNAWSPIDFGVALATPVSDSEAAAAAEYDVYRRGYDEGRADGELAERARLRLARQAAEEALEAVDAGRASWTDSAQENVIALGVAIARHIIDRELTNDPAIVTRLVEKALAEFPIDQPLRIRVHPDDLAVLEALDAPALRAVGERGGRTARWHADARVTPGGCVVEGRDRIVDGRIDTALERVYRRLTHSHA